MSDAFIISARRTPVSPIGGTLSRLSVWEMTQQPIKDCIDDARSYDSVFNYGSKKK